MAELFFKANYSCFSVTIISATYCFINDVIKNIPRLLFDPYFFYSFPAYKQLQITFMQVKGSA